MRNIQLLLSVSNDPIWESHTEMPRISLEVSPTGFGNNLSEAVLRDRQLRF